MTRRNVAVAGFEERWPTPAGWMAKDGCTILGCGRPGIARGLCWFHYARARRGLPVYVYAKRVGRRTLAALFGPPRPSYSFLRLNRIRSELRSNVTWEPNTGCWLWLGTYNALTGRPSIGNCHDPWNQIAARAVLHFNGVRLERRNHKRMARHLCDQPACVNPAHIVYGTAKENAADRDRRYERGEIPRPAWQTPGPRKMSAPLVAYARAAHDAGASVYELARDLGLTWMTVAKAIRSVEIAPTREAA